MTTITIVEELEGLQLIKVNTTFDRPVAYYVQRTDGTRIKVKGGLTSGQALLIQLAL